jgi:hypothetical protein
MSSLRCWMTVALLMLPASACNMVSRYLAGMDDPMYFTWERSGDEMRRAPVSSISSSARRPPYLS